MPPDNPARSAPVSDIPNPVTVAADTAGKTGPAAQDPSSSPEVSSPPLNLPATGDGRGAYRVWPADTDGNCINYSKGAIPNPSLPQAVEIYYGLRPKGGPPTKEQNDLQAAIEQVRTTICALYLKGSKPKPQFRLFYVRLFRLAQLGLEANPMPDIAKASLNQVIDDLISAEGGRVKNAHLLELGTRATLLGSFFLFLYAAISLAPPSTLLPSLGIDPVVARSFLLLWTGCFGGVWLSYAIRTTTFTLRDLVIKDDDRLLPTARLVFAGALTMILGLLLALGFVDARIGNESLAAFTHEPTKALLLGLFCGVSELLLPSMIGKRAADFLSKFQ